MKKNSDIDPNLKLGVGILILVSLLLVAFVLLRNKLSNQTSQKQSNVYVLKSKTGDEVPVSVSKEIDNRLTDLSVAGDLEGINRMLKAGLVFTVPNGTEVLVIERGLFLSEVKIQSGSFAGKYGWVSSDWLAH